MLTKHNNIVLKIYFENVRVCRKTKTIENDSMLKMVQQTDKIIFKGNQCNLLGVFKQFTAPERYYNAPGALKTGLRFGRYGEAYMLCFG